jgi:hypothetical protein
VRQLESKDWEAHGRSLLIGNFALGLVFGVAGIAKLTDRSRSWTEIANVSASSPYRLEKITRILLNPKVVNDSCDGSRVALKS